jgi:CHAT domain-containing protein
VLEARGGGAREGPAWEMLRRGLARLEAGEPDAAVADLGGAVREFKLAGDLENESHALKILAILHNQLGHFAAAAQYHATGLEAARRLPRGQHLVVEHLDGLGSAQSNRGRWQEALELFGQALAAAGEVPTVAMRRLRGCILQHRANVFLRYPRDYASALAGYDEALQISRELQDRTNIAFCLTFQGECRQALGDAEAGVHLHEAARQLAEEIGDPSLLATVYAHLANAYHDLGQRPLAVHYGRRALELDQQSGNRQGQARDHLLLGVLYCREGDDEKALAEFERGFLLARTIQDLQITVLLTREIGGLYRRRRQGGARQYYEQALELCRELRGAPDIEIGLRAHLAAWLESGPAREVLAEQLAAARQAGLSDLVQQIATALGDLARQDGDLEEAKAHYREAVAGIEEMRASFRSEEFLSAFSAAHAEVYQRLVQLCAATGDDDAAFEVAERSRARVLGALLHRRARSRHQPFPPDEERRYRDLCQRVLDLDLALEAARMRGEAPPAEVEARLHQALLDESEMVLAARRSAPLLDRLEPAPVVSLGELQGRLRGLEKDLLVLVYATTEDATWLFALDRHSCELLPLPLSNRELRDRVLAFRRSLNVQEVASRHAAAGAPPALPPPLRDLLPAQRLFTDLLDPVRDRLARAEHLCIVPHGSLHYLPFQALHDGERYLIERLPVSAAPSATVLSLNLGKPFDRIEQILALGNPTCGLAPLPWAAWEVGKIAGALGERCRVATKDAAQRRLLLGEDAAGFDTWHLATHAVFVQSAPHLSYFQLATAEGDDGRVFAFELAGLEQAPRLVIASACQTALTQETPGDEVNGLLYSLLAAGCPTVVGSLWRVDDYSTQRLMINLYRQMQSGGAAFDLAVALQQAQLQLLHEEQTASPGCWAPFVLQGTWATLRPASAAATTAAAEAPVVRPARQAALHVARGESQLQRAARLWEGATHMQAFEALKAAVESFSAALEIDAENLAGWRGRGLAFLGPSPVRPSRRRPLAGSPARPGRSPRQRRPRPELGR